MTGASDRDASLVYVGDYLNALTIFIRGRMTRNGGRTYGNDQMLVIDSNSSWQTYLAELPRRSRRTAMIKVVPVDKKFCVRHSYRPYDNLHCNLYDWACQK